MIVKNEEKVLPRILKPMKEIVDKILICDTGSTDRTKEIIREFTAEVYDFPWKNDFSAARNFISEKVRIMSQISMNGIMLHSPVTENAS